MRGVRRSGRLATTALAGLLGALLGCRSAPVAPPAPLLPPPAKFLVRQFPGSPIAGLVNADPRSPAAETSGGVAETNLRVKVELFAVAGQPGRGLEPLASRARLIIAGWGSNPILPSPRLLAGSAVGSEDALRSMAAEASGRLASMGSWTGLLIAGRTWALQAGDLEKGLPLPGGELAWRHLEVLVHRGSPARPPDGPTGIEVAIAKEDRAVVEQQLERPEESGGIEAASSGSGAPAPSAPPAPNIEFQRELVLLPGFPEESRAPVLLLLPFRFSGGSSDAVAALITIDDAPPGSKDPFLESAVATANLAFKESSAAGAGAPPTPAGNEELVLSAALDSLKTAFLRRRALTFLSERTGAGLGQDLALAADDAVLAQLAARIAEETAALEAPASPAALGFALERSGFAVLAELLAGEKAPAELKAVLLIHAGEAGRDAATIEEVLRVSMGIEDLERRLIDENLICLDDSSPSSRVRAIEWLRARNQAPEGYQPLGPLKDRRIALEKALSAKEEMPAKSEGKPK